MRRHIQGTTIAALAVLLLALPAAASPAGPDTPGDSHAFTAWTQGIHAWLAGALETLESTLPWSGGDADLQRVDGADEADNSYPHMDPNGLKMTDPDDAFIQDPELDPEP